MKINVDLKAGFLQSLKREVLAALNSEERAVIEVSTGDMGNKPDAVKLGWLKMRTGEIWTKPRYTRALKKTIEKLKDAVAREGGAQRLSGRRYLRFAAEAGCTAPAALPNPELVIPQPPLVTCGREGMRPPASPPGVAIAEHRSHCSLMTELTICGECLG